VRTTASQSSARHGVKIHGAQSAASQSYWGYCTNVTVDGCIIYAQTKPVAILSDSYGTGAEFSATKYVYDNINVIDTYTNSMHHYGSNIHLVHRAAGYRVNVIGCTCIDSADDGLEINNSNEVLVENCHFEQNRQSICFTWFSYPYKTTTPNYTIRGCTYSGLSGTYWPVGGTASLRAPMMPELRGYTLDNRLRDRSWGNLVIEDCVMEIDYLDNYTSANSPFKIGSNTVPLESVTITNCDITDENASPADVINILQGDQLNHTLPISIHDVRFRSSHSGSYALLTSGQVTLSGDYTVDSDIAGL
jgi:hypothetical protein